MERVQQETGSVWKSTDDIRNVNLEAVILGIKKYVNHFQPGEQGYEYTGNWYRLSMKKEEIIRQSFYFAAELAVVSLLFFLGLTGNNAGGYIFWILIPYMCQFLPLAYGWMGIYALLRAERNREFPHGVKKQQKSYGDEIFLRQMDYDRGIRRPWRCGLGLTVLSGAVLAADILLVLPRIGELEKSDEWFFLTVCGGIFAVSLVFALQSRRMLRKTALYGIK